jgi:magnesium transporter
MTITILSADAAGLATTTDPTRVAALIAQPDTTVWIDADEESAAVQTLLCDTLGVHELTVEDIFTERIAPKIEEYPNFLYVVVHGVRTDPERAHETRTLEVDVVFGANWVFTHRTRPLAPLDELRAELARNPRALQRGAAFMAHAVIDHLIDCYTPVVDHIDEEIDALERSVVVAPSSAQLGHAFARKRGLQQLRRTAVYQRDILHRLSRGEFERVPPDVLPFFRDAYDQFVRVSDLVDSYRELLSSVIEVHVSVTANRTNDIMKVLTLISTVMLPLTFIAGLYGMNFEHMPELRWRYGYPMALGLMLVVVLVLLVYFRRRRWL